jgi:TnpA family transposase
MPRRFLSQAERQQLSQFPPDISKNDLIIYFTLTDEDKSAAFFYREPHNQLGFAILLCTLRYLGFFPTDLRQIPASVVSYVAKQLAVSPSALDTYERRSETRWEQLGPVMKHLGFQRLKQADKDTFVGWLGERALSNDRPSVLLQLACERLYQLRFVRPAITTVEELIADTRQWAQTKTVEVLVEPLPQAQRRQLTTLLEPITDRRITPLTWIRRAAVGFNDKYILDALDKLAFIRQWSVANWDVTELPPSRLKFLAQVARYTSNQGLARKKPVENRDAFLVAFLWWAHEKVIDELIDLFDLCLADALRKSRRELKEYQLAHIDQMHKVVGYFQDMTTVLLNEEISDADVRPTVYEHLSPEVLQATLLETEQLLIASRKATALDFFDRRYSYFRRFIPTFLKSLKAIDVLRELNQRKDRLPPALEDVPTDFISAQWRPRVLRKDDLVNRRDYEMCVISELRDALRSGAIWLEGSRRYADIDSYLIPKKRWPQLRPIYCEMVGVPEDGGVLLAQKQADLEKRFIHFNKHLPKYSHVRIEDNRLVLSPLEKEEAEIQDVPLTETITSLLPWVQTGEMLVEIDSWTRFSDQLTHVSGSKSRLSNLPRHLFAVILAQGCNIDLRRMAELADLSYDLLIWCANWYIRAETLQEATNALVNFQYQQWLSHRWGSGTFSSSDGQRFAVARKTNKATPLPRYFGYGRGLTFLTWTSDQLSQYGTRVTPPTMREATYVLDAILDNETDLNIQEHTTDTAGYTDLIFALFDLLGLQFSPRLHDIGDRNLYRIDDSIKYKHIEAIISRPLDLDLIEAHWDDLLRVAASMKMGWVTASTLISRLQAYPRQHKLTQVLQEYGRLVKTIFILHYLEDGAYRRRILVQLNKGEQVHRLRQFLFFDNRGLIRKQQPEDLVNQAGCLNLLSNAVIVWNTVYMQAALEALKKRGYSVNEAEIVHLSPVRFEHINPYGKFQFDFSDTLTSSGLRPLRSS